MTIIDDVAACDRQMDNIHSKEHNTQITFAWQHFAVMTSA